MKKFVLKLLCGCGMMVAMSSCSPENNYQDVVEEEKGLLEKLSGAKINISDEVKAKLEQGEFPFNISVDEYPGLMDNVIESLRISQSQHDGALSWNELELILAFSFPGPDFISSADQSKSGISCPSSKKIDIRWPEDGPLCEVVTKKENAWLNLLRSIKISLSDELISNLENGELPCGMPLDANPALVNNVSKILRRRARLINNLSWNEFEFIIAASLEVIWSMNA